MPIRPARKSISKTQIAFRAVPKAISKIKIAFRTGSDHNVKIRNPDQERPGQPVEAETALAKLGTALDQAIFTALSSLGTAWC